MNTKFLPLFLGEMYVDIDKYTVKHAYTVIHKFTGVHA